MLKRLMDRRRDEEGFTLIELMVVVLIIGILVAIALPTFLGARERAQNKAAQSSLRNALAAAKTIFTDTDDYSGVSATSLTATEPSLTYVTGDSAAATEVSWDIQSNAGGTPDDTIALAALADTGNCYYLRDVASDSTPSGTRYGPNAGPAASTACAGSDSTAANTSSTQFPG